MMHIKAQGDNWVITIPKDRISESLVLQLLERIEIEDIIKQSELTEAQALELSESLKENWWKGNRERILAKIQAA